MGIAEEFERQALTLKLTRKTKVAIMGCVVNGPGEAADADVGIAGGKGEAVLFKKGQIVCKLPEDQLVSRLIEEIKAMQ